MNPRITVAVVVALLAGATVPCVASGQLERQQRHRVPADYMSFRGADWLERDERVVQEQPEQVLDVLGLEPGNVVADVGCGSGYHARRIARRVQPGGKVFCVDIQPEMLEIMETRAREEGVTGIQPVLGTPSDPMLPAGALDWIFIADVYHEMSDPESMLARMKAALAPGGQVALLEYRVEDGTGDMIKADHTMSVRQVLVEWQAGGFDLVALHDFLPSQHLFVFRAGGEPDEVLADYDLYDAVERGLVEVEAQALDEETVTLRVRRRIARDVVVTAPVATYFRSTGRTRDMVARRDSWVLLPDDGWHDRSVRVVGRQFDRDPPDAGDPLELLPPSHAPQLEALLHAIQVGTYTIIDSPTLYPPRTFDMEQAAVWVADGDVDYGSLSAELDDTPIPRRYAVAFALVFCDLAGVDMTTRHVWQSREEIFQRLRDPGLNAWFDVKAASSR